MLPDVFFSPLDLDDAIDAAQRSSGARGVVDLLVTALTDKRVRRDADIDAYLDPLKSACRQTRRYREAIPVLRRIAVLNPRRRHEMAAEVALVHGHLKEPAKGIALLETAFVEQRRLPAHRRSFEFCLVAEVAAAVLRHPSLAREVVALGQSTVPTAAGFTQPLLPTLDDLEIVAVPTRPRLTLLQGAAA
jgi:hypothetical protein